MEDTIIDAVAERDNAETTLIKVSVSINKNGQGQCTPDPVPVPVGAGQVQLLFVLDESVQDYRFEPTGAVVPVNQFPQPSVTSTDHDAATLENVASKKGQFPYSVQLRHVATGEALAFSFDPMIDNQA